jgi:peptidoglycan hydrolase-like protein with peptidoglycan-binding domain
MKNILLIVLACFAGNAQAATYKINLPMSSIKVERQFNLSDKQFSQLNFPGVETSKTVGSPELPVKTWLIQARPEQIKIHIQTSKISVMANTRPAPVQPQACRCDNKSPEFQFDQTAYTRNSPAYQLNYLGSFRGTPVTQVQVNLAKYYSSENEIQIISEAKVTMNMPEFSFSAGEYRDYLILAPANLVDGVTEFAEWKRSRGFNVIVETLGAPNSDLASVAALIAKHYKESGTDFVIFVGDDKAIPMYKVATSGSQQTPTDLRYLTMDGADDFIPDMFASRISAASADEVKQILSKSKEYELKTMMNPSGWKKFVGIASNEGSNPSDNEYVLQIDAKFKSGLTQVTSTHLFQNDSINSNPKTLNDNLNQGAFWLTYLGHGSGTSWPSMNRSYSTADIKNIANKDAVKPVIIDVACMNGNMNQNNLGASFMRIQSAGAAVGAAAYYGGTVNISWHPPAIMAQGIVFEHMDKKFKFLGEALLAGQMYLASKWTNKEQVIDNFEWYHLQGDPGMSVEF